MPWENLPQWKDENQITNRKREIKTLITRYKRQGMHLTSEGREKINDLEDEYKKLSEPWKHPDIAEKYPDYAEEMRISAEKKDAQSQGYWSSKK